MLPLFAAPAKSPGSRIDSVDILRGLMALSVATYHLSLHTALFPAGSFGNNAIAVCGLYGVQGFFIVSGFCFFHLYGDTRFSRDELAGFHIKRFFRIAPLYYLAMIINTLFRQVKHPFDLGQRVFENITFTFGLVHPARGQVAGGWSIGVEYVFYFALPLLVLLTRRKWMLYVLAAFFSALAVPYTFSLVPSAAHFDNEKFKIYVQLGNHAFLFFAGGILAHLRSMTPRRLHTGVFAVAIVILAVAARLSASRFFDHFDCVVGFERVRWLGFCIAVVALSAFYDVPKNLFRQGLVFLGDISYSVYLMHPFALMLVLIIFKSHPSVLIFVAGLATTILLSALTCRFVEKPAMKLGRRLAGSFSGLSPSTRL